MTVPAILRQGPARRSQRIAGLAATTLGAVTLLATFGWLAGFFLVRGVSLETTSRLLTHELGHWSPVLFFALPGGLLVRHGRQLMRDKPLPRLVCVEILGLAAVLTVTALLL